MPNSVLKYSPHCLCFQFKTGSLGTREMLEEERGHLTSPNKLPRGGGGEPGKDRAQGFTMQGFPRTPQRILQVLASRGRRLSCTLGHLIPLNENKQIYMPKYSGVLQLEAFSSNVIAPFGFHRQTDTYGTGGKRSFCLRYWLKLIKTEATFSFPRGNFWLPD